MFSSITDNFTDEVEAVGLATERCLTAEERFGSGMISLIDLYKIYQQVYLNLIPPDADVDYGPWSHIFWRRRRLLRLVNEEHLRKSRGRRGGHRGSRYWDACDLMDGVRDVQTQLSLETDAVKQNRLHGELHCRKRIVRDWAKIESKRFCAQEAIEEKTSN